MEFTPEKLVKLKTITPEGLNLLKEIANSNANIIITGNHGSGKTTLAKIILNMIKNGSTVALVNFKEPITIPNHYYKEYHSIDEIIDDNIRYTITLIENHYTFNWEILNRIRGRKIIITINPNIEREVKRNKNPSRDIYIIKMKQVKDPAITRSYAKIITSIKKVDKYTGEVKTIYEHKL